MTSRQISAWIVPLKGHAFDLEDLPIYLDGSPVTVVKRGDRHFLQISTSVAGTTHERVEELAVDFLGLINGAASVLIDGYRPLEFEGGGFYGIDAIGEVANTVIQVSSAEMRCKAGHVTISVNGVTHEDGRKGLMDQLLREATRNRAKADALALVGRPAPSWSELYLVFELVEANAGSRMYADGWIGRAESKLFTRTANSYTALGKAARHGKDRGDPPTNPMHQRDAVRLMRSLVAGWLKGTHAAAGANDG
ncbi:MAG: hypothetical protein EPO47_11190 [Rugosibacter sp.]|nr:MAG: hypothetical protein EPO60_04980 [Rugosibacter sp.]TBR07501.1 MAG: hypothetical protein EPO47_11190 [Rugosibacter sp.]